MVVYKTLMSLKTPKLYAHNTLDSEKVLTRGGHSGRPTRPDFFHPESGWARFAPARPVCKNSARPDRDRAIPIQPVILSSDLELEFITEKT